MPRSRSWPSPFEIAEPDLRPLHRALTKCGVPAERSSHVAEQLSRPPLSFGQSATDDPAIFAGMEIQLGTGAEPGSPTLIPREFDPDVAARVLHLSEGHPEPDAKWKTLSRAERKRATRLWDWIGRDHGLSVVPKGRPPVIDAALVLYCIRFLCEASGRPQFEFSRPNNGGAPSGPMWQALIEALPSAQRFLAIRYGTLAISRDQIGDHAEAIVEIVTLSRSRRFKKLSQLLGLGAKSDDVAAKPAQFRALFYYARKSSPKRRMGRR
jgi:hypothetical protein